MNTPITDAYMSRAFAGTYNEFADLADLARRLERDRAELVEALKVMYESEKDYITINNLGDPHHNQRMKVARALLARIEADK